MWRRLPVLLVAGTLALTGCSSSSSAEGPTASVTAPPTSERTTTTTALTPEQQVEAAYLKSWDVYAKAVRKLDDRAYGEIFAEDALQLRENEMAELRRANTPVRISIEHNYTIQVYDNDQQALVLEAYTNHSVLLNGKTGQPTEPDPNDVVKRRYQFRRTGGSWKIVRIYDAP